jgi:RNA polymerase sigma factor (sigma-70 family)
MIRDRLEEHIRENHSRLLAQLVTWGVPGDRREDILHEAVASAFDALDAVDDVQRLEAWFHQLLRNRAMDFHRARDREYLGNQKWVRERKSFFVPKFKSNYCQCVHDVLPTLKREYEEVIRQVEMSDDELRDVAARLGITYGNLKVRLHRARKKLRQELEKICQQCATQGCLDCTCGN